MISEAQVTAEAEFAVEKFRTGKVPGVSFCYGKVWAIFPDKPTTLVMANPDTLETEMEYELAQESPETEDALRKFVGRVA